MKAATIDEYIENAASGIVPGELGRLADLSERLWDKVVAADPVRHPRLQAQARILEILLVEYHSSYGALSADKQRALVELGAAAAYLLKGYDVIPDEVEEIGFDDDAFLIDAVFSRNRPVIEEWISSRLESSIATSLFAQS
ncbi:MAG: hypothetical protein BGO12_11915 [Verrucomicrobia bacterium 61-8]|nr:hypothetical protein [Verrucomicrobiota bacterium]OJV13161.1 MAG: hypothetical protein BGO12_11915 [Verrucomicrobia bacterium 61-8]